MKTYWMAVKREARDRIPTDWISQLKSVTNINVVSEFSDIRVEIMATDSAIEIVRQRFGEFCYIESNIPHKTIFHKAHL